MLDSDGGSAAPALGNTGQQTVSAMGRQLDGAAAGDLDVDLLAVHAYYGRLMSIYHDLTAAIAGPQALNSVNTASPSTDAQVSNEQQFQDASQIDGVSLAHDMTVQTAVQLGAPSLLSAMQGIQATLVAHMAAVRETYLAYIAKDQDRARSLTAAADGGARSVKYTTPAAAKPNE